MCRFMHLCCCCFCCSLLFYSLLLFMFISRFRSSLLRTNLSKYHQLHRIDDHTGVNCCQRRFVGPGDGLVEHGPLLLSLWCYLSGIALYDWTSDADRNQWRTRVKYTLQTIHKDTEKYRRACHACNFGYFLESKPDAQIEGACAHRKCLWKSTHIFGNKLRPWNCPAKHLLWEVNPKSSILRLSRASL